MNSEFKRIDPNAITLNPDGSVYFQNRELHKVTIELDTGDPQPMSENTSTCVNSSSCAGSTNLNCTNVGDCGGATNLGQCDGYIVIW